jgi:hypothetical protein
MLIEWQRRTMGRLLGSALSKKRYVEAQQLMQPLNDFWNVRGLGLEARGGSSVSGEHLRRMTDPVRP